MLVFQGSPIGAVCRGLASTFSICCMSNCSFLKIIPGGVAVLAWVLHCVSHAPSSGNTARACNLYVSKSHGFVLCRSHNSGSEGIKSRPSNPLKSAWNVAISQTLTLLCDKLTSRHPASGLVGSCWSKFGINEPVAHVQSDRMINADIMAFKSVWNDQAMSMNHEGVKQSNSWLHKKKKNLNPLIQIIHSARL